ncbi:MAG: peptidylprolyl isomerase [Polyangiaceae bacterium]
MRRALALVYRNLAAVVLGGCTAANPPASAPPALAPAPPPAVSIPEATPEPEVASPIEVVADSSDCRPSPRPRKSTSVPRAVSPAAGDPVRGQFGMKEALAGLSGGFPLVATLETSHGTLSCELWDEVAPLAVANFVGLARGIRPFLDPTSSTWAARPAYDGVIFHRVISGFMIQGGDPTGTGRGEPGYVLPDELDAGIVAAPGVLYMANRGPDTNGMQFFIMHGVAQHITGRYTAFGRCEPLEVVDRIARVPTSGGAGRPAQPPVIRRVTIALAGPCSGH